MRSPRRRWWTILAGALGLTLPTLVPIPVGAADADLIPGETLIVPFNAFHSSYADASMSSPAYGDVTGDGHNEIVVGGMDGRLSILTTSGGVVGRHTIGPGAIHSSPTLVDLDGNGVLDIVVGTTHGDVVGLRANGSEIFRQRTCGTPGKPCDIYASIAVGDIDNDSRPEIVVGGGHHLHAFETNGNYVAGFPVETFGTTWTLAPDSNADLMYAST